MHSRIPGQSCEVTDGLYGRFLQGTEWFRRSEGHEARRRWSLRWPRGLAIAQVIAWDEPELVRKLILTGTGPAGGKGMKEVVWVAQLDTLRGLLSRQLTTDEYAP